MPGSADSCVVILWWQRGLAGQSPARACRASRSLTPAVRTAQRVGGRIMAGTGTATRTRRSRHDLLGIYLNDHLAGATGGPELARRVAASHRGPRVGAAGQRARFSPAVGGSAKRNAITT